MNRPWLQLYTRDWLDNKELRRCSPGARAVLTDLMCLAHEGEPYGHLADKLGPLTEMYMASRCVLTPGKFRTHLDELKAAKRVMEKDGVLYIERMVRDEDIRVRRAAGGMLSIGHHATHPPKSSKGYPSSQTEGQDHSRTHPRADSDSDSSEASSSGESLRGASAAGADNSTAEEQPVWRWDLDETFAPLVSLYRSSGKPVIDEDFEKAWWSWKMLDFDQKRERIESLDRNLRERLYSDPNFIPAPRNFVDAEWKRKLRKPAAVNGAAADRQAEEKAAFAVMVKRKYGNSGQ